MPPATVPPSREKRAVTLVFTAACVVAELKGRKDELSFRERQFVSGHGWAASVLEIEPADLCVGTGSPLVFWSAKKPEVRMIGPDQKDCYRIGQLAQRYAVGPKDEAA